MKVLELERWLGAEPANSSWEGLKVGSGYSLEPSGHKNHILLMEIGVQLGAVLVCRTNLI